MGNDNPDGTTSLLQNVRHFVGGPTLIWYHEDLAGESVGLGHWESDCDGERGKGLQQTAHGSWQTEFIPAMPTQQICSPAVPSPDAF